MKKRWILFLGFLTVISCAPDDNYSIPPPEAGVDAKQANVDLDALLGLFYQNEDEILSFKEDLIFEAFVISSDEAGNHYKELVVQDKPDNPTAGLNIKLNMTSYYSFFNFGRKVYVNVKGLSIGIANGVPSLGVADGKTIGNIPQSRISEHIFRSSVVEDITPLPLKPAQFSRRLENLYVEIEDVQFSKFLVDPSNPFTFAAEDNDEFDGERLMESCSGDFPFILSTSTFADFSGLKLPSGSGTVKGILTRDFYDEFYTIYLNYPSDLNLKSGQRCDPVTLDCGISAAMGSKIIFEEDFSSQKNNKPVTGNGWTNFVQEGSRPWEAYTATGANASLGKSARMRPGGSGDQKSVSWLITPPVNFDANTGETLSFKTSTSFANGSMLEVLFSNTWNGKEENLLGAEWQLLSAAYVARNNDFFGDWMTSGIVDLSCAYGKGYIAFRYTGSDLEYYNGIYELDEIVISADN